MDPVGLGMDRNGHGHGLSQWGARRWAGYYGWNAVQIIAHYYTGVEVVDPAGPRSAGGRDITLARNMGDRGARLYLAGTAPASSSRRSRFRRPGSMRLTRMASDGWNAEWAMPGPLPGPFDLTARRERPEPQRLPGRRRRDPTRGRAVVSRIVCGTGHQRSYLGHRWGTVGAGATCGRARPVDPGGWAYPADGGRFGSCRPASLQRRRSRRARRVDGPLGRHDGHTPARRSVSRPRRAFAPRRLAARRPGSSFTIPATARCLGGLTCAPAIGRPRGATTIFRSTSGFPARRAGT